MSAYRDPQDESDRDERFLNWSDGPAAKRSVEGHVCTCDAYNRWLCQGSRTALPKRDITAEVCKKDLEREAAR